MSLIQGKLCSFLLVLSLFSCVQSSGLPWATIEAIQVKLVADVPADRELNGNIKTATNYLIHEIQLDLQISAIELLSDSSTQASVGISGQAFDPSQPPVGCTLCHGGHCHCNGELISYEVLSQQGSVQQSSLTSNILFEQPSKLKINSTLSIRVGQEEVDQQESQPLSTQRQLSCQTDNCDLDEGTYRGINLKFSDLHMSFKLTDRLSGEHQRFDHQRVFRLQQNDLISARIDFEQAQVIPTLLNGEFDSSFKSMILNINLSLPIQVFDQNWASISDRGQMIEDQLDTFLLDQETTAEMLETLISNMDIFFSYQ